MTYREALKYIHSLERFGSQLGLERMEKLLSLMGNPHKKLKFVHIAGTNGKGTTAQMSTKILISAGYKVGTYISPFVLDFRERFQVNNQMIEKSDLTQLVREIIPHIEKMKELGMQVTEFEVVTAVAFMYFYRSNCDIVCLEVGLGGRLDATNVIDTPEVAIITSISVDHAEILGDTIEKIAGEKAGIIKNSTTVVTYPLQDSDALATIMQKCSETNSTLILPNANTVDIIKSDILGSKFYYNDSLYSIKLAGKHQVYNAVAVIEAMHALSQNGFSVSNLDIKQGLTKTTFAARFEIMNKTPTIILDGAHNKQAVQALSETMDLMEASKKIVIIGMMADKDYEGAVESIGKKCNAIITIPVDNPRAIDYKELAEVAKKSCPEVYAIKEYQEAFAKAMSLADEDSAIIVCGSFYMASDMRNTIKRWKHMH